MYKLLVGCHLIVIEKNETEAPRAKKTWDYRAENRREQI